MGTPIPSPDFEPGNDCTLCRPVPWPAGETPLNVYAYFEGIIDCGISSYSAPNGQTFRLEQNPASPCTWLHNGDPWILDWIADEIAPNTSRLRLMDKDGFSFFSSRQAPCPTDPYLYSNDQATCILMYAGASGSGLLTQNTAVIDLVEQFGLEAGINLMWEVFNHPDGDIVHKFSDIIQRTNIRFKLTP